jgi:GNAT superfamily N-acetyltransferase
MLNSTAPIALTYVKWPILRAVLETRVVCERCHMVDAATYTATEHLRDGRAFEIRALRPRDEADMLAAVDRIGAQSLYRRFMGAKRGFSDKERAFFVNVDFVNHVALVAVVKEQDRASIVAGGRYIVEKPGTAEVAFAVVDDYQGQGIGAVLLRHLAALARQAGVKEFTAEVLPDNTPMLKVFERSGLKFTSRRSADGVHAVMQL